MNFENVNNMFLYNFLHKGLYLIQLRMFLKFTLG